MLRRRPSLLAFALHCIRSDLRGAPPSFRLGFWLFLLNWPVGYGGAAVCGAMALRGNPRFWGAAAAAAYALSWGMLGLGTLLLGASAKSRLVLRFRRQRRAFLRIPRRP